MVAIIIALVVIVLALLALSRFLNWRFVLNCFYEGNVIVSGLRGRGKDVLFSLVTNSSKCKYISNVDYTGDSRYVPFNLDDISVGGNTYVNFIKNDVHAYEYPHEDGIDYFISDSGIYFPSQEFSSLNRWFPSVPVFMALSRHLGDCNFHCNVQNLNRLWDKIREQADTYLFCTRCKVRLGHFVSMTVYYYDRYQSCVDRVKPMRKRWGRLGKLEYDKFTASYGSIRKLKIWGVLRHDYNSRIFKEILRGQKDEKEGKTEVE
jgi:hypothetical protein